MRKRKGNLLVKNSKDTKASSNRDKAETARVYKTLVDTLLELIKSKHICLPNMSIEYQNAIMLALKGEPFMLRERILAQHPYVDKLFAIEASSKPAAQWRDSTILHLWSCYKTLHFYLVITEQAFGARVNAPKTPTTTNPKPRCAFVYSTSSVEKDRRNANGRAIKETLSKSKKGDYTEIF